MLTHDHTAKARNTWILKLALCAILLAGAAGIWAQTTYTWVGTSGSYGGDGYTWASAANWLGNSGYPGDTAGTVDTARFTIYDGAITVYSLVSQAPNLVVSSGRTVSLPAAAFASVTNAGSLNMTGSITASGTITVSGAGAITTGGFNITAGDISISTSAAYGIDANTSALTISGASGTNVYLGSASGTGINLTNAELGQIRASGGLSISASGMGTITATSVDTTGASQGVMALSNTQALTFSGTNIFSGGLSASTSLAGGISIGASTELSGTSLALGALSAGANGLTLTCDTLSLTGGSASVTGSGALVLRALTPSQPIVVNGTGTGSLFLTPTDIAALDLTAFSSITIGQATGIGVISLGAALSAAFTNLAFLGSTTTANLIQIDYNLANSSSGRTITFSAPTRLGSATVSATNATVSFGYAVTIADGATAVVSTTGTGALGFSSTIDGNSGAGNETLSLTAGTGGLSLGAIGGNQSLYDLSLTSAAALTLPAIDVSHNLTATTTVGAITQSASAIIVGNLASFTAPTTNSVTLMTGTNDFSTVQVTQGLNASLTDANAVSIDTSTLAAGGALTIDAVGVSIVAGATVTAPGGATVTAGTGIFAMGAASTLTTNNYPYAIAITADDVDLNATSAITTGSGGSNVTIVQSTNSRPISLGTEVAGSLSLTSAELARVTTTGSLRVGNANSGALTVNLSVSPSGATSFRPRSGASITGSSGNIITATNLYLYATTGISVYTSAGTIAARTTSGGIAISDSRAAGTTIGTVETYNGISSNNTAISFTKTSGALAINQAINSGTADTTIDAAAAVTQSAVITAAGLELLGVGPFTLNSANVVPEIAGNVTGALNFTRSNAAGLSIGSVGSSTGLRSTSTVTLVASGNTISQTAPVYSATSLTVTSTGGTTLTQANTVASFTATNTTSGGVSLNNTAGTLTITSISGAGAITVSNTGNITTSGAIGTGGTANSVSLTATGLLTIGGTVTSTTTGTVNLTGLGVTNNSTITGPGGVAIDAGTGTFTNNSAANSVYNGGGSTSISITADNMVLSSTANAINAGTGGSVTLLPSTASRQISIGAGTTLNTLGLDSLELGTITTSSTGILTIGDSGSTYTGGIVVDGNATTTNAAGPVELRTYGAITRSAGTFTTAGALRLYAQTGIGSLASPPSGAIHVNSGGTLSAYNYSASSGDIYLYSTRTSSITLGGASNPLSNSNTSGSIRVDADNVIDIGGAITAGSTITLNATGALTDSTAGALTAANVALGTWGSTTAVGGALPVVLSSTATTYLAAQATGATGVNVSSTGSGSLTVGYSSTGVSTTGGNGPIYIRAAASVTVSQPVSANGSGTVTMISSVAAAVLTTTAGNTISSTSGNIDLCFNNMSIGASVSTGGTANVYLSPYTQGRASSIAGSSAFDLSATEMGYISAGGTIFVGRDAAGNLQSGAFTLCSSATANLSLGAQNLSVVSRADIQGNSSWTLGTTGILTLNAASGIGNTTPVLTQAATITFANTSGAVVISDSGAAGTSFSGTTNGAVSLTQSGASGMTVGGVISSTNNAITLRANAMTINANVASGTANTYLLPNTSTNVNIGTDANFGLTETELGRITTTAGTIYIGEDSVPSVTAATVTVATAAVNASTKSIVLSGDNIQGTTNALTAASLQLKASNGIGSTTAVRTVSSTIGFSNTTGNAVSITDGYAGTTAFSGANSAASGGNVSLAQTNASGALSIGAAGVSSGTGAYVSLSSAGAATQSGNITAPGGLELLGSGSFDLNRSGNSVPRLAANLTGSGGFLHLLATGDVSIEGVNGSSRIVTSGTGGYVDINPTGTIYLNVLAPTVAIQTSASAVDLRRPVSLSQNAEITCGTGTARAAFASTVENATSRSLKVNGAASFASTVGDVSPYLLSLEVTGATTLGASCTSVTTTGAQTYGGNVSLGAGVGFVAGTSTVWFKGTVAGVTTGRSLTIGDATHASAVDFDNVVSGNIASVYVYGATTTGASCSAITTSGTQTYTGAVTLGANAILSTTDSTISFGASGISGAGRTLELSAGTGSVVFAGQVGASGASALGAITIDSALNVAGASDGSSAAGAIYAASLVQTTGTGRTYLGAAATSAAMGISITTNTITTSGTLTTGGSGPVTLHATVGTTPSLTIGGTIISDGIVSLTGTNGISLGGNITTTDDAITFNNAATLTASVTLTSSSSSTTGGAVRFLGAVNGAYNLSVANGTGTLGFDTSVGYTTPLGTGAAASAAITATGSGTTTFSSTVSANSGLTIAGAAIFDGAVTLDTAGSYSTTNKATSLSGDVTLNAAIFSSGNGITIGTSATNSLTLGTGVALSTTVNGATTSSITINSTITGAHSLGITTATSGSLLIAASTATGASAPTAISATSDSLTLGSSGVAMSLATGGGGTGDITFSVNELTLSGSSNSVVATGGTSNVFSITTRNASTPIQFAPTKSTTLPCLTTDAWIDSSFTGITAGGGFNVGAGTHTGVVYLGTPNNGIASFPAALTINQAAVGASAIYVANSFVSSNRDLTLSSSSGGIAFHFAGTAIDLGTAALTITGPATLYANTTITANGTAATNGITFNSAITVQTDNTYSLTLNSSNLTNLSGAVGASTMRLASLTTDSDGTTDINGGSVHAYAQSYYDAVTLGATPTTLGTTATPTTAVGSIGFGNTLDGAVALTLSGPSTAGFGGAVGGTTHLTSLSLIGPGTLSTNAYNVTSDGSVTVSTGTLNLGNGGFLYVGGDLILGTLSGTTSGSTIVFDGGAAQGFTTNGQSPYNLTLDNSGGATLTVTGNLPFAAGGVLTLTRGTLQLGASTYSLTLGADLSLGNANSPVLNLNGGTLAGGTHNVTIGQGTLSTGIGAAQGTGSITTSGDFTLNNANALAYVGPGTFTVGSMSVTVSGGTFTQTGNNTLPPTYVQSIGSLSVSGGACTWDSTNAGGTLTVSNNITFTGGTRSFGHKNLLIDGNSLITSAGTSLYALTIQNGGVVTLSGALTATSDLSIQAGGSLDDSSNAAINVAGDWLNTGGSFTAGSTAYVTLNGTAQTLNPGASPFVNLAIASGTTVTLSTNALSVTGALSIDGSSTMDMADRGFSIGTLSNDNILELDGSQSSQSVATPDVNSGTVLFKGSTGGAYVGTSGFHTFYNLELNQSGASFSLGNAISVIRDLTIASGTTFDVTALDYAISIGRGWNNNSGTFVPRTGTVSFSPTTATGGTFHINGATTWYQFYCSIAGHAGLYMEFQRNHTQTILSSGSFYIHSDSSADKIIVTRDDQSDFGTDLDWVSSSGPPDATRMWQLYLSATLPAAVADLQYVDLYYSDARSTPTTYDPTTVTLGLATTDNSPTGEVSDTCYAWQGGVRALYSYTEDSDHNGKIDRIRVTASSSLNGDFGTSASQFLIAIDGYTVDTSKGTRGYYFAGGDTFYIYLVEKNYTDGNVRPAWRIATNTVLKGVSYPYYNIGALFTPMTPTDTVPPLVSYTLALPGYNQVFYAFSEPVYNAAHAALSSTDYALFPSAIQSAAGVSIVGSTSQDYGVLSNESSTISADNIVAESSRSVDAAVNDNAIAAVDYTTLWAVSPSYPNTVSAPPNALYATSHRVSDVLVSVWPSSASSSWSALHPNSWFVWPIYAKDQVKLSLTDAQIEALSPAQTAAQGIGLIRAFDGSQWLRDQDLTMQARVNASVTGLGDPSVIYDSNVSSSFLGTVSGLWLPTHLETKFSGLDGFPNAAAYGGDPSGPTAGSSIGSSLYDWQFLSTDSKVFSVAQFDFWFRLAGAPSDLYAGRLAMDQGAASLPSNWYRLVRPFAFYVHNVALQKGGVTILNNVIDPTKGETARLDYQLATAGAVTVTVFTLDGDVVARLVNASAQAAGDYAVYWNGKNLGGNPVARGLYFVRLVAPGMDEIRKVIVVRK